MIPPGKLKCPRCLEDCVELLEPVYTATHIKSDMVTNLDKDKPFLPLTRTNFDCVNCSSNITIGAVLRYNE